MYLPNKLTGFARIPRPSQCIDVRAAPRGSANLSGQTQCKSASIRCWAAEHVLRKIHHCTFRRKISERPFLRILPQNLQFTSDDFFLVITFFTIFCPSVFSYFTHDESYSYFCALYTPTPYIHTHMLFSRFYTLLCALVTVYTAFTIYFFLIHHCTSSLSSLHIFVHNCTFCASLHTKWSPLTSLSTWEHKQ